MRNIQKIFIGIFISGVVLGGIGTGLALKEFSDLNYGGRSVVGTEHLVTKELDFHFPMDGKTLILGSSYQSRINQKTKLVEDETIPVGTVRYEVTYNERVIEPFLGYEEYEEEEPDEAEKTLEEMFEEQWETIQGTEEQETKQGETHQKIGRKEPVYAGLLRLCVSYEGNGFELFMENKNRILEDLKQKKLSSYETAEVTEVTIKVNPETMQYIEDRFSRY